MPWEILMHEEVADWMKALPSNSYEKVIMTIQALSEEGPALGRPQVDHIKHSKLHNLKELRPLGTSLRILFAFDFKRRAILLVAGNKKLNWIKWYEEHIPLAESRFIEFGSSDKRGDK
ncbi:MAG: type II toxin-antitoxin system RelE/ParE family toxin [Actinomycetota bacterium]